MWMLLAAGVGALSYWMTGLLARPSSFFTSLDHPNERSLHLEPTPRTGGVAMVVSTVAGVAALVSMFLMPSHEVTSPAGLSRELAWILSGMAGLSLISFIDDRKSLSVSIRFGCQSLAACVVVFVAGVTIRTVTVPGVGMFELGAMAPIMTVLFILWMTNLYNFMDGMDGFAGGMTVFGFSLLAYLGWMAGHQGMFLVCVVQAAAAGGFLAHNFPPAKIFMGDVGSVPSGFLAGSMAVLGCQDRVFDIWVPLMVFSPFIVDATMTLFKRALRLEKVWHAHREHYYQRLVLMGWGHRRTVCAEYGLMALCGLLALVYQRAGERWQVAILAAWAALFVLSALAIRVAEQRA
ncbi:Glycosyl transferase, family 4, conserved region [Nitrospira sp. KM1]|uniref:glycosyltransferase family 4 protein n=1 Tax=Nitrospira sp. KM1 TaxID=1936990 RepID=UPI0013A73D07|nr:glycosyltransferase family 4 protein [Nitrospira sp. KM1]BCA54202.1 Glycosyl transferase, family 4, conserved region [Nitrospira sp. KM1]